ncbi:MAG: orotate phosphoribosyltransferase [Armatimonadetes bacterium]|nr:orotate phosphoribosyltransferase [Armatimonadota bacterium]
MQHPELAEFLRQRSYQVRKPPEEPFRLTSGKTSWHYFECQKTTSFAPALPHIGAAFYGSLLPEIRCVGGLTRGADPVADAVAFYSAVKGERPVHVFSVRKQQKEHGLQRWIEGSAAAGDPVAVVDDVATTGGSVITAIQRAREAGLVVRQALVLVDREEGGMERIQEAAGADVPVSAIFRFSELQRYWGSGSPAL